MQYQTEALVLKTTKLNDSDKILKLFTLERGPVSAIAKGARKMNSSFGIKAEVLAHCDYLIAEGKNLDIVSQSKLKDSYKNIRTSFEALTMACFWVEAFENIIIEDEEYEEDFQLITGYLHKLDKLMSADMKAFRNSQIQGLRDEDESSWLSAHKRGANEYNPAGVDLEKLSLLDLSLRYLWDLISLEGYKPELNVCSLSGRKKDPKRVAQFYDFEHGSIVSTAAYDEYIQYSPYQDHIQEIDVAVYKILQALDLGYDLSFNALFDEDSYEHYKSAFLLLVRHLKVRLEVDFKSWSMLESLL